MVSVAKGREDEAGGVQPGGRLRPLLEASSVAVVGASARPGTVGHHLVRQLRLGGFEGRIELVNPRYAEIDGLACHPAIGAVPPVDLAVLAVANDRLEGQLAATLAAGARSVAVFASCHGTASTGEPLAVRLGGMLAAAGVPACGGNGMGFLNLSRRLRVSGFYQPWDLRPGPVTFVTHSGSLFSAMLHSGNRLGFDMVVSTGNEMATTMDEYLDHALEQPATRVIGMFLETVRRPGRMAEALVRAAEADVPVVALKVGRTERSRASVATHSAALAGAYETFGAFAAAHGVHLVDTMDEMVETLAAFSGSRRASGGGPGFVLDSGGERSLLLDTAERIGLPMAELTGATRRRLEGVLAPGLEPENPVDAWGTGHDTPAVFGECLDALAADPEVGVVVLGVDLTTEEDPDESYVGIPIRAAASTDKPIVVLANVAASVDATDAARLAEAGIPVLRGTETGLRAIGHLLAHGTRRPPRREPVAGAGGRVAPSAFGDEVAALAFLATAGIPIVDTLRASGPGEAVAAARRLGFPVVLKTASGIEHKSEAHGVLVGLGDADAVLAGYADLAGRLGPEVVVQAQMTGVEAALGVIVDEQFGPVVMVAAGGEMVELIDDRAFALAPLDRAEAARMIAGLRLSRLLDGARGRAPADRDALLDAVVALSRLAVRLSDDVAGIDVNPLVVRERGCVAVDALVVARSGR